MKRRASILYWGIISILLLIGFGISSGNFVYAFYFLMFFLPVIILTSHIFNSILVPHYLMKKRYGKFALLSLYTIIISLDLEFVIVFIAFLLISFYDFENMDTIISSYKWMPVIIYFIVLLAAFISVLSQLMQGQSAETMKKEASIMVRSERKNRRIQFRDIKYIESMADYVRIYLDSGENVITREKISHLDKKLPDIFLRIHRSYIVNLSFLVSYDREELSIGGKELPISRTYKKEVMNILENQTSPSVVN